MEGIEMVNLKAQYNRLKPEIDAAIQGVCQEGAFIRGLQVSQFETNLAQKIGVKHVIGVANGTDALQIALMALDLEPGDEILIPAFAYAALPEAVQLLGLKPVFVDVRENDFLLDISDVENKITNRTRVIAPVHLFGLTAEMDALVDIAQKHGLYILEDAAQSMGSKYCSERIFGSSGTLGDIGTTSFFPSKNLGCYGDGGAVFTNSDALAAKVRMLANHGQIQKYHHEVIGLNSRLDTIQAAILNIKLPFLDNYISRRVEIAGRYNDSLGIVKSLKIPQIKFERRTHAFHQYTVIVEDGTRDQLREFLKENGIPSMIYYPLPLHKQKAYATKDELKISEQMCQKVISLPICPELSNEQQSYIINKIHSFYKS